MRSRGVLLFLFPVLLALRTLTAGETDPADLRLRFPTSEILNYEWNIHSTTDSKGQENQQKFSLTSDTTFKLTQVIRGLPTKTENQNVSLRIKDMFYGDKRSVGDIDKSEMEMSKARIKAVQNGKVVIDSDNDIGLEYIKQYNEHVKNVEAGEMRIELDPAGRQGKTEGDPTLVDTLKSNSSQGLFPILAGKSVAPGESWVDTFSMERINDFRLSRPAVVRSKMTFKGWEDRNGKRLARIEIASAWEKADLKGENTNGMLVKISQVEGAGGGTCLFDAAAGRFIEGKVEMATKYHIDGEQDVTDEKGQPMRATMAMDVSGVSTYAFKLKE